MAKDTTIDVASIPRIRGGYGTVLIDPPWPYAQKLKGPAARGGAEKHYSTVKIEDIAGLPVADLLAPDAMVWLWTTNSHLFVAHQILIGWGLTYKVMATWAKRRFGLGYWLRGKSEHILLGVIGRPRSSYHGPHGAVGSPWSTLIEDPAPDDTILMTGRWRGHSVKPPSSYEMIEALSPRPRLELFARVERDGWTSWGDEIPRYAVDSQS